MSIVQRGTSMQVGFPANAFSSDYCIESYDLQRIGEIEEVMCDGNETTTILISNKGNVASMVLSVTNGTSISMDVGDQVTIEGNDQYFIEDISINYNPKLTKVNLTAKQYNSLTLP